jgi:hypothetical protein
VHIIPETVSDPDLEALRRRWGEALPTASPGGRSLAGRLNDVQHKLRGVRYHRENYARHEDSLVAKFSKDHEPPAGAAVVEEDPRLVFEVEGFLYQLKSALDMLAHFLRDLGFQAMPDTFGDKGDGVIKALRHWPSACGKEAAAIEALVREAQDPWLDDAVATRDRIAHRGVLDDLTCFIQEPHVGGALATLHYPTMPSGERARACLSRVEHELRGFVDAFIGVALAAAAAREAARRPEPNTPPEWIHLGVKADEDPDPDTAALRCGRCGTPFTLRAGQKILMDFRGGDRSPVCPKCSGPAPGAGQTTERASGPPDVADPPPLQEELGEDLEAKLCAQLGGLPRDPFGHVWVRRNRAAVLVPWADPAELGAPAFLFLDESREARTATFLYGVLAVPAIWALVVAARHLEALIEVRRAYPPVQRKWWNGSIRGFRARGHFATGRSGNPARERGETTSSQNPALVPARGRERPGDNSLDRGGDWPDSTEIGLGGASRIGDDGPPPEGGDRWPTSRAARPCSEPIDPADGVVFLWGTIVHLRCADRELPPRKRQPVAPDEPPREDRPEGESVA